MSMPALNIEVDIQEINLNVFDISLKLEKKLDFRLVTFWFQSEYIWYNFCQKYWPISYNKLVCPIFIQNLVFGI